MRAGAFLKGLILTEQNKPNDAIKVFTDLSQDYPELPEPYNNLAVLYASQGQYDKARNSLEMAIRTHPSYATAHENLGDIYAKMASQAYDKALQLDRSNAAAQTKLNMIKDLFSQSATTTASAPRNEGGCSESRTDAAARQPPAPAPAAAPRRTAASCHRLRLKPQTGRAGEPRRQASQSGSRQTRARPRAATKMSCAP